MSDAQYSEHQDPDGALLFDLLRRSGSGGRDAHLLIRLLEKMASAKLIQHFETKLEVQNAQISALRTELTTKFDTHKAEVAARLDAHEAEVAARLDAHEAKIIAKLDGHKTEIAAKLDGHKTEMAAKLDAQQVQIATLVKMTLSQFRFTKWLIGIGFSIVTAVGVAVGIVNYLL